MSELKTARLLRRDYIRRVVPGREAWAHVGRDTYVRSRIASLPCFGQFDAIVEIPAAIVQESKLSHFTKSDVPVLVSARHGAEAVATSQRKVEIIRRLYFRFHRLDKIPSGCYAPPHLRF